MWSRKHALQGFFPCWKEKNLYINVNREDLTIHEEQDEKKSQHSQDTNNEDGSVKVPVKVKEELTEAPAARKRSAAPWEESSSCASSTMSVASQTSLSRKKTRHLKWLKGKRVPTNQPDLFKRASPPKATAFPPNTMRRTATSSASGRAKRPLLTKKPRIRALRTHPRRKSAFPPPVAPLRWRKKTSKPTKTR